MALTAERRDASRGFAQISGQVYGKDSQSMHVVSNFKAMDGAISNLHACVLCRGPQVCLGRLYETLFGLGETTLHCQV